MALAVQLKGPIIGGKLLAGYARLDLQGPQIEVEPCDIRREPEPHRVAGRLGGKQFGARRFIQAPVLSPEIKLEGGKPEGFESLVYAAPAIDILVFRQASAAGGAGSSCRGKPVSECDTRKGAGFLDPRQGELQVAVVQQRFLLDAVKRRIFKELPPALCGERGKLAAEPLSVAGGSSRRGRM